MTSAGFLNNATAISVRPDLTNAVLSFAQQRLWFLQQLDKKSAAYHHFIFLQLTGKLDLAALEQSVDEIVKRHEVLRTFFPRDTDSIVPRVRVPEQIHLTPIDLPTATHETDILQDRTQPFDVTAAPPWRVKLLRVDEQTHVLIFTVHQLIGDDYSKEVLIQELLTLYAAFSQGQESPLTPLPIQYSDFAYWQRQMVNHTWKETLRYWQQQLSGALPLLKLPTDKPRPAIQTLKGDSHIFQLEKTLLEQLRHFSERHEVTLFMTLLSAFVVLLARYSNQEDILVGTTVDNRNQPALKPLIGYLSNIVVLRTQYQENLTFIELLTQVKQTTLQALAHQQLPFEKLLDELKLERNPSYSPLFQVMFGLQDALPDFWQLPNLTVNRTVVSSNTAKFDLTLWLVVNSSGIQGIFEYNNDLFDPKTIQRMAGHLETLLKSAVSNPLQTVAHLPLFTETEQQQILVDWNATQVEHPPTSAIKLFEAQVLQQPEAVALTFENHRLTYRQLNTKANQLGSYLRSLGVGSETLVGVYVERSVEIVIALLGILKAGGAYISLDPSYPKKRLEFMIQDTQVSILLTQNHLLGGLPGNSSQVICLDGEEQTWRNMSENNLDTQIALESLAYIIYTSGSTGTPKGVMVSHASLANYVRSIAVPMEITSSDVYLHTASFGFSASVRQMMVPLCHGSQLVLATAVQRSDPVTLFEFIKQRHVTITDLVPSYWRQCMETFSRLSEDKKNHLLDNTLRLFISSAEPLLSDLPQKWRQKMTSRIRLINMYGQTETAGLVTAFPVPPIDENSRIEIIPAGRPMPNVKIYILNAQLQPVPIGVQGEIYVGGNHLARGYLNLAEATAKNFITNPFSNQPGERLYKTGDLARYHENGVIEFLGRRDNQVKIRGFRIELGEIEAVLTQIPTVQTAVVVAHGDTLIEKQLVAYLVPKNNTSLDINEIRRFIREKLPDYMVPAAFLELKALPLTPNGKIDRRALPALETLQTPKREYIAPRNETEQQLAHLWQKVLNLRIPVSIHDNFFDLGGHSLLAITLLEQIQKTFRKDYTVMMIFQTPTIAQMAEELTDTSSRHRWRVLEPIHTQGTRPPLFFFGSTHLSRSLLPYLGPDQPVYGLNIFGLQPADGSVPHLQVEEIAKECIKEIRSVQPEGPYYLASYCGDAKTTFEIGRQLRAMNQPVGLLAFVDAFTRLVFKGQGFTWQHHWRNLLAFGPSYFSHKIKQKLDSYYLRFNSARHRRQAEKIRQFNHAQTLSTPLQYALFIESYYTALNCYTPHFYPGKLTLFYATEWQMGPVAELRQLAGEGIEIYSVRGYHDTLFTEPQVQQLGTLLKHCLDKSIAPGSVS